MRNEFLHKKPVEQSVQIIYCHICRAVLLRKGWPTEATTFTAFVVESEAVLVPMQNLNLVFVFIAKDKDGSLKRIKLKRSLDHSRQSID